LRQPDWRAKLGTRLTNLRCVIPNERSEEESPPPSLDATEPKCYLASRSLKVAPHENGGNAVGLLTVLGFAVAFALSQLA
jgi:hypothetical protein